MNTNSFTISLWEDEGPELDEQGRILWNQGPVFWDQGPVFWDQGPVLDDQAAMAEQGSILDEQAAIAEQGSILDERVAIAEQGSILAEKDVISEKAEIPNFACNSAISPKLQNAIKLLRELYAHADKYSEDAPNCSTSEYRAKEKIHELSLIISFPKSKRYKYYDFWSRFCLLKTNSPLPVMHSWCVPTYKSIDKILSIMKAHKLTFAIEIGAGSALPTHLLKSVACCRSLEMEFIATDTKHEKDYYKYEEYEHVVQIDAISAVNDNMHKYIAQGAIVIYFSWGREFITDLLTHITADIYNNLKIFLFTFTSDGICENDDFYEILHRTCFLEESLPPIESVEMLASLPEIYTYLKIFVRPPGIYNNRMLLFA